MKQFTTPEQTAKLIELGFERPKIAAPKLKWVDGEPIFEPQYTIGELIKMLPACIVHPIWWGDEIGEDGVWGLRIDSGGTEYGWYISYERPNSVHLYNGGGQSEMIDALYDTIVELKADSVI